MAEMQFWPQLESPESCTETWWNSSSFLSLLLNIFIFFSPWATSRFFRVLVFCLAHLLPFLGAVTLPWLVLMGVSLSLLLSLTFTISQCIWGWLVGLITAGSAVLKGGSAQVVLHGQGCTKFHLIVGKREQVHKLRQLLPFSSLLFWGHLHPKIISLSNLPVSGFCHWLLIFFFKLFFLENMACIRCSSRVSPNPVNSLEQVHAVSPSQSMKNPCVLQASQSSAVGKVLFSVYLKRKGGTGGY